MTMTTTIAPILAYVDRRFKYLASFLYFCDNVDKLLALKSNSVKEINSNNYNMRIGISKEMMHLDDLLYSKYSSLAINR